MDYIKVSAMGSYYIGGKKVNVEGGSLIYASPVENMPPHPFKSDGDYQVGQMYVQYTRLANPIIPYPVCMIHGGGMCGAQWESTLDGHPGWGFRFLQKGYHVYISDGVERGRASWAKYPEIYPDEPLFRNYEEGWQTFRLGEHLYEPYNGLRFDVTKFDYFMKQQIPRWLSSARMSEIAYNEYIGSFNDGCILLAHSQGGLFALKAALAYPGNIKGIILIESSSTLNIDTTDISPFKNIPILHIWGDFLGSTYVSDEYRWVADYAYSNTMRNLHNKMNQTGGNSTWIHLPELGIRGNSHALMVEDNSDEIADIIFEWMNKNIR